MSSSASKKALAAQARRGYLEVVSRGVGTVIQAIVEGSKQLAGQPCEPAVYSMRRDLTIDLPRYTSAWHQALINRLRTASQNMSTEGLVRPGRPRSSGPEPTLTLVDDNTIEHEILASRMAQTITDRAAWQYTDMRARLSTLENGEEITPNDLVHPQALASFILASWLECGLSLDQWRTLQPVLHDEWSHLAEEAYHETNRWLLAQGVRPEIDLRSFIKRSRNSAIPGASSAPAFSASRPGGLSATQAGSRGAGGGPSPSTGARSTGAGMMGEAGTGGGRAGSPAQATSHAQAVLGRLNQLMARQIPDYHPSTVPQGLVQATPALRQAIESVQSGLAQRHEASLAQHGGGAAANAVLLEELQQTKQALKQAATSPIERATIEIVALMFQNILTEERIPPAVRVWFARLQMPVLRVAVSEPDFFADVSHPARKLIDRMGACVMGFESGSDTIGDALEKEIKRVVQVVEAYPDTGRRVFQTVLTEFERFLDHYFKTENEASKKGVSLAQQVEQREILAIQYTIELRKMLNQVPVQDGVRDFLFHVWADVLATSAIKSGAASDDTKAMQRAAADLIWSASAKVSREERAEVIRRLPPLLKVLREGMTKAGLTVERQDEHIQSLNKALAAAFSAKTASVSSERVESLMMRLETLDEMLPDAVDIDLDENAVMDLSGHESADLEVVGEGGSMPTPAMLDWAASLQIGTWYKLDYRNRVESVQLAWQGMRKRLILFVTPQGRGILFQVHRLASFLQAGLLVPAEEEALTVRATRKALAKLDADPGRLLN